LQVLRKGAVTDKKSSLTVMVVGRSNSTPIAKLKSSAATQFGTGAEHDSGLCDVNVIGSKAFQDCLAFIEGFLEGAPGVLKSASLTLAAVHFRWRGAPDDSAGTLHLFDWKALRPARRAQLGLATRDQRSALNASMTCSGPTVSDPAFLAILKTVAEQTGIAFPEGRLSATHDPEREVSGEARSAIDRAVKEAFDRTGADLRKQAIDWRGRPGLMPYSEAVESRFQNWGEGGRVSLPGPIKRMMKTEFPEFTVKTGRGFWFFKSLSRELALHVCYDTDRLGGIGKGFSIEIGVEWTAGPLEGKVLRDNLFRLFDADRLNPCWTYSSKDDLADALAGLLPLLRTVLSSFEFHCRASLETILTA
jgi:hypothetical protein